MLRGKTKAFTLAEVLITLGIIGVVAAMTLPTLINNINNKQNIAALKKSYSIIYQAAMNIIGENGSLANLCDAGDTDCLRDLFKNHVKTIKSCDKDSVAGNCWVKDGEWKRMNGVAAWSMNGTAGFVLNDGTFVAFRYNTPSCDDQPGTETLPTTFLICGTIAVDVNGSKLPNVMGKDIFYFYISENKIVPFGTEGTWTGTDKYYRCENGGDGEACAAKYISGVNPAFKN